MRIARDVDGFADGERRRRRRLCREVPCGGMEQRHEAGRDRKRVPSPIDGGGQHQHATGAHLPLGQSHGAVVVTGHDVGRLDVVEAAVTVNAGRRQWARGRPIEAGQGRVGRIELSEPRR